jgi:hypothetical protein
MPIINKGKVGTDAPLQTCGLTTIQNWSDGKDKKDWKKWFEEEGDCKWGGGKQGNILFSITSSQLKRPSPALKAALKHPGTRIIHAYKQNAHGPNWICFCVCHLYPDTNALKNWKNNIAEYQQRFVYKNYQWYLND